MQSFQLHQLLPLPSERGAAPWVGNVIHHGLGNRVDLSELERYVAHLRVHHAKEGEGSVPVTLVFLQIPVYEAGATKGVGFSQS